MILKLWFISLFGINCVFALPYNHGYHGNSITWERPNQHISSDCLEGWTCVPLQRCRGAIRPGYLPKSRCGWDNELYCCGPSPKSRGPVKTTPHRATVLFPQGPQVEGWNQRTTKSTLIPSRQNEKSLSGAQFNNAGKNFELVPEGNGMKISRSEQACKLYSQMSRKMRKSSTTKQQVGRQVVGGVIAAINEFPYLVAIGYNRRGDTRPDAVMWGCGGSIISETFVLTAAHCITDAADRRLYPTTLRAGQSIVEGGRAEGDYGVAEVIRHPQHRADQQHHDLALLRVDRPFRLSGRVRPVCLPPPSAAVSDPLEASGSRLLAAGWGATKPDGTQRSTQLKKVALRALSLEECKKIFALKTKISDVLDFKIICAADPRMKSDTCEGDSGGPLVRRDASNKHVLVGVTSFGGMPCAGQDPGVYARPVAELTWIESVVWP